MWSPRKTNSAPEGNMNTPPSSASRDRLFDKPRSGTFPGGKPNVRGLTPVHQQPKFSLQWKAEQTGSTKRPNDVCFLPEGLIAVAEKKKGRIRIYDEEGKEQMLIDREKDPGLLEPSTLLSYDEKLLLAADLNQIHYFNLETLQCVDFWQPESMTGSGSTKTSESSYSCLHGVCITRNDEFVVTDVSSKPSVGIFSPKTSKLKRKLKLPKGEEFKKPFYVTSQQDHGLIYVSDSENGCVFMFDGNGRYLKKFGKDGEEEHRLIYPLGISLGQNDNTLIVADEAKDKVSAYSSHTGKFMYNLLSSEDGLSHPLAVRMTKSGRVAVTEEFLDHKKDRNTVKLFQTYAGETPRRGSENFTSTGAARS